MLATEKLVAFGATTDGARAAPRPVTLPGAGLRQLRSEEVAARLHRYRGSARDRLLAMTSRIHTRRG